MKTWKNGKAWAEADRSTTGAASRLLAQADRPEIKANGKDLSFVTITIADDKGRLVPQSMNRLKFKFKVEGDAEIAGICNGDPTSHESMQGDTLPAFNGLCQVILRGQSGKLGKATLLVESEGLPTDKVTITTR